MEFLKVFGSHNIDKGLGPYAIISDGGEGIVVTKPQSHYIAGHSKTRLKIKVTKRGKRTIFVLLLVDVQ